MFMNYSIIKLTYISTIFAMYKLQKQVIKLLSLFLTAMTYGDIMTEYQINLSFLHTLN